MCFQVQSVLAEVLRAVLLMVLLGNRCQVGHAVYTRGCPKNFAPTYLSCAHPKYRLLYMCLILTYMYYNMVQVC